MRPEFVWIALVAIFWGGWPLVSRASGVGGPVGSLILSLASLVPISILAAGQGFAAWPATADVVRLVIAGVMMGGGLVAFNLLANAEMEASISVPIVDASMLLVTAIGAIWFFGEAVTARKVVGLVLLLAGIAVLRPE